MNYISFLPHPKKGFQAVSKLLSLFKILSVPFFNWTSTLRNSKLRPQIRALCHAYRNSRRASTFPHQEDHHSSTTGQGWEIDWDGKNQELEIELGLKNVKYLSDSCVFLSDWFSLFKSFSISQISNVCLRWFNCLARVLSIWNFETYFCSASKMTKIVVLKMMQSSGKFLLFYLDANFFQVEFFFFSFTIDLFRVLNIFAISLYFMLWYIFMFNLMAWFFTEK